MNFIRVPFGNFLHTLFKVRLYLFVALSFQPLGEEMIVAKRMFARFDAVLFAKFHAQIRRRTAIDFFGIFIVSRMPFRRLGSVPIKGHGSHIEKRGKFLFVKFVLAFVVGNFV